MRLLSALDAVASVAPRFEKGLRNPAARAFDKAPRVAADYSRDARVRLVLILACRPDPVHARSLNRHNLSAAHGPAIHRFLAADLSQGQLAAFVVEFLKTVETVATVAHHFAGLADIAELLGELQQSNLGADDLLFSRHGASPPRPLRAPPRLVIRRARPGHHVSD
jgi:hypothetical protein